MWQKVWWCCVLAIAIAIVVLMALALRRVNKKSGCCCKKSCKPRCRSSHHAQPPPSGPICGDEFDVEDVPESYGTTTICLSCIDYRFVESIPEVLQEEEDVEFYDPFSLAGGSLGYNQTVFSTWPQTWLDTVQLAITLHKITQIIIVEHMDCGMYTNIYGPLTPDEERQKHIDNMQTFQTAMATQFPTLAVRGYLVYLDGHAERLI
jgi:carbonic anhydrase